MLTNFGGDGPVSGGRGRLPELPYAGQAHEGVLHELGDFEALQVVPSEIEQGDFICLNDGKCAKRSHL